MRSSSAFFKSPLVAAAPIPSSSGAVEAHQYQGKANERHRAPPDNDTADFFDGNVGNCVSITFCRAVTSASLLAVSSAEPKLQVTMPSVNGFAVLAIIFGVVDVKR